MVSLPVYLDESLKFLKVIDFIDTPILGSDITIDNVDYCICRIHPTVIFVVGFNTQHELCPFCGGKPVSEFKKSRGAWKVECENRFTGLCPMNMRTYYYYTEQGAFEKWDTRHDKLQ